MVKSKYCQSKQYGYILHYTDSPVDRSIPLIVSVVAGPQIIGFCKREGQRLMVRVKHEGAAFEEISKVTNG